MRVLLLLLVALLLAGGGFALGHRAARRGGGASVAPVDRPRPLEQAWRAWLEGRRADVPALLAEVPDAGARVRDEARLLAALAAGDRAALARLADDPAPLTVSVRAAALRELARGSEDEAERGARVAALRRLCPGSWALGGPDGVR